MFCKRFFCSSWLFSFVVVSWVEILNRVIDLFYSCCRWLVGVVGGFKWRGGGKRGFGG